MREADIVPSLVGKMVSITYRPITSQPTTVTETVRVRKVWRQTFAPFALQVWTAPSGKKRMTIHSATSIERLAVVR